MWCMAWTDKRMFMDECTENGKLFLTLSWQNIYHPGVFLSGVWLLATHPAEPKLFPDCVAKHIKQRRIVSFCSRGPLWCLVLFCFVWRQRVVKTGGLVIDFEGMSGSSWVRGKSFLISRKLMENILYKVREMKNLFITSKLGKCKVCWQQKLSSWIFHITSQICKSDFFYITSKIS